MALFLQRNRFKGKLAYMARKKAFKPALLMTEAKMDNRKFQQKWRQSHVARRQRVHQWAGKHLNNIAKSMVTQMRRTKRFNQKFKTSFPVYKAANSMATKLRKYQTLRKRRIF